MDTCLKCIHFIMCKYKYDPGSYSSSTFPPVEMSTDEYRKRMCEFLGSLCKYHERREKK